MRVTTNLVFGVVKPGHEAQYTYNHPSLPAIYDGERLDR